MSQSGSNRRGIENSRFPRVLTALTWFLYSAGNPGNPPIGSKTTSADTLNVARMLTRQSVEFWHEPK